MKMSKLNFWVILALIAVSLAAFWFWPRPFEKKGGGPAGQPGAKVSAARNNSALHPMASSFGNPPKLDGRVNDLEFNQIRVNLPAPENVPWKSWLYNSEIEPSSEHNKKLGVAAVLPLWIRKAAYSRDNVPPGEVPGYLWTLIKLMDDSDPEISSKATFGLYQLGDYGGIALAKIKTWFENGNADMLYDTSLGISEYLNIREMALRELSLNHDHRLDGAIYNAWFKRKNNEGSDLEHVDYAYYLEKNGRSLPTDYWLNRLQTGYAFLQTLEILEARKATGLVEQLEAKYQELRPKRDRPNPTLPAMASALYRLTGNQAYLDDLLGPARTELLEKSSFGGMDTVVDGLGKTQSQEALDLFAQALQSDSSDVVTLAARGLSHMPSQAATDVLVNSAVRRADQASTFAEPELAALLEQGTPYADEKYDALKQALLKGQFAWKSSINDFDRMDFYRAHQRNTYNPPQIVY